MSRINSDGIMALMTGTDVGREPMALLQGYPFTGFVKILDGALQLAPAHRKLVPSGIPWDLFWDIRVFGDRGERHIWKLDDRTWDSRYESFRDDENVLHREYPVWGTPTGILEEGWSLFREERGPEVWIPSELASQKRMVLEIDQILGETSKRGIESIVDAMIRRLKPSPLLEEL